MDTKTYKVFHIDGGPNLRQLEFIHKLIADNKYPTVEFILDEDTSIEAKVTDLKFYTNSVILEGIIANGEYKGKNYRAYYDSIQRTGTFSIFE